MATKRSRRLDGLDKEVARRSSGQSGDNQQLSRTESSSGESVEELADTDQAREAAFVEGIEDAADHPERPAHMHLEYHQQLDDVPPRSRVR